MKFTINYPTTNQPNLNNRIYPPEVLKEGFKKYRKKIKQNYALGELERIDNDGLLHLNQASHLVTKVIKKRKKYEITCKTLKTPIGKLLEHTLISNKRNSKKSLPIEMRLRGSGSVDKKGIVTNFQIFSCDIYKKEI